jgi:hypothetical protein
MQCKLAKISNPLHNHSLKDPAAVGNGLVERRPLLLTPFPAIIVSNASPDHRPRKERS